MRMVGLMVALAAVTASCTDFEGSQPITAPAAEVAAVPADDGSAAGADGTCGSNSPSAFYEVETSTITTADADHRVHTVTIGVEPSSDANCNPWRFTTRSKQHEQFAELITVLRDVKGTYTDENGRERTTRAARDAGWTLTPVFAEITDQQESFRLICDGLFDGFTEARMPASDIGIEVRYDIQYAERDNARPARVRPIDRKGSFTLTCPGPEDDPGPTETPDSLQSWYPVAQGYYIDLGEGRGAVQLTLTPTTDADGNDWSTRWTLRPSGAGPWTVTEQFSDGTGAQYIVECDTIAPRPAVDVTLNWSAGQATRENGTSVTPRNRSGTLVHTCPAVSANRPSTPVNKS